MAPTGTCRLYRPDPTRVGATEQWSWAQASATTSADSVVVTISGEIDASNCAELAGYVERHVGVAGTLVLDLSAVAFFGTTAWPLSAESTCAAIASAGRWCRARRAARPARLPRTRSTAGD